MTVPFSWLVLALLALTSSACAKAGVDQSLTRTYRYECTSVPPLRIESVRVRLHKSDAIIIGELSRIQTYTVDPHDYVEVSVIGPHGKLLSSQQTHYFPKPVPHFTSRFGNQYSSYGVEIHFIPPAYSTIKVTYVRLD